MFSNIQLWGITKIAEITVYGYAAFAALTVWRWINPPPSRSEIRGRRCSSSWPTWYAPKAGGYAESSSSMNQSSSGMDVSRVVATKESRKGGWRSHLQETIESKKFSTTNPSSTSTALVPRVPSSSASVAESWAGPHLRGWRCQMRRSQSQAAPRQVTEEGVQVTALCPVDKFPVIKFLTHGNWTDEEPHSSRCSTSTSRLTSKQQH